MKRNFFDLTLKEALKMVPVQDFTKWVIVAPQRPSSDFLEASLRRLE